MWELINANDVAGLKAWIASDAEVAHIRSASRGPCLDQCLPATRKPTTDLPRSHTTQLA